MQQSIGMRIHTCPGGKACRARHAATDGDAADVNNGVKRGEETIQRDGGGGRDSDGKGATRSEPLVVCFATTGGASGRVSAVGEVGDGASTGGGSVVNCEGLITFAALTHEHEETREMMTTLNEQTITREESHEEVTLAV
ncbi:hypothetical protein CC1G_14351 [Coprinopsis cinerea okayama7|uniref:Uncharacterized protein n=1 Tax=Coprinopsis cinerea (strain Okayama-7 / 130 / ATCC MYA-4618 / FGSC 9003) TaxID=240176 RepID=D6RM00_COPC7|nr:hypothetical protein CC1G_14351 [Coprinopsis cinerea okayama7\|eukprot:XP_002911352.1 hypothetical protein CC1G_14351 [Coprinopsis cinerea okayama7\